ncbi:hypothetical protein DPMN_119596 [Dreissena polymorpha]|uniref:Uncharacterized protein n=1 Tax=Dreissena polymorpha TaxID=45954 RepID=A0A9D4GIG3_DREPO|nr:hypothetical protein DPMN_119596 [Dreissena polymorpha]
MIEATLQFIERNGTNYEVPFNVILDWDDKKGCFTVARGLGRSNRKQASWIITVSNMYGKVRAMGFV